MLHDKGFLRRRLEHSGAADLNPAYRLISSHQLIADNPEGAKMFSQHHPCMRNASMLTTQKVYRSSTHYLS